MKNLEMKQMELVQGGLTNRDCLLAGMAVGIFAGMLAWEGVVGVLAFAGDCFSN